ncbi:hypothetical protein ACS78_08150 [Priestia megaterium]|uniref:DUF2213 domain-containing protein n=1 Tax=Priestia megaterium TaxID=1404 RepID=UPI0006811AFB|nr:DUF2213 domain-containing protein [Priestia megaterium]KNH23915.1 hypothetical protein ACS78_08150 [Priestia megaterium]
MKHERYDRTFIKDYNETNEGYLTVRAPITRPGVFPYMRQDGSVQLEAKLPEEIFSDRTMFSAHAKPVTDDHPNEPVTLQNYNTYSKGLTHNDARVEDFKLYISFTVTDAGLIQKIKDGKREISLGFLADVVPEKGTYDGKQYDFVQRNTEVNHVAIVDEGRVGPEVSIRGDSAAYQIDSSEGKGDVNMAKYTIDGKEYEVDSTVKSFLDAQQARLDTANLKAKDFDTLQGRYDALEVKYQNAEKDLKQAKENNLSADELDAKVQSRVELISGATTFLGDSFDFKGKSEREIKEAVIQKAKPDFKGDGKSDDYIDAFFDATLGRAKQEGFSSTGNNHMFTGDGSSSNKQIEEMKNKRLNMK